MIIPPQVTVNSRRALRHGSMTNGVHADKWFVVEGYRLEYAERVRTCQFCYRHIEAGEVYGVNVESLHYPLLCADCLTPIPPGAQIWRVSLQMRRKSKKHPDKLKHEFEVCKPDQMADYMRRLTEEYPGSTCEAVGEINSTFAYIDTLAGNQRATVTQMIDAAGLPLEGTTPSPCIHGGEVYDLPFYEVMPVIDFDKIEKIEF